jgi:hypothetical protein
MMTTTSKREYVGKVRWRYQGAGRVYKGKILDEFCATLGYERKWAIRLLNRAENFKGRKRPGPVRKYKGKEFSAALRGIWLASGQLCGKRLKAALPLWVEHYEQSLNRQERELLLAASAATLDRLLMPLRVREGKINRGGTKPGSLLKTQIPIRTEHWDVTGPGYVEADTVAHCGNSLEGDFIWSVVLTDIHTGWTAQRAVWNKGAAGVREAIGQIEASLPFALLGFDSDNGSEFLNNALRDHFLGRKVGFTRSRPYHKNDNAHVEQKNWTHARQLLGYGRLDDPALLEPINRLYAGAWQQLQNHYCPSMKLLRKHREGARYCRKHDEAQTPLQRLLNCAELPLQRKEKLQKLQGQLNPFVLSRQVEAQLKKIAQIQRRQSSACAPVARSLRSQAPCACPDDALSCLHGVKDDS